MPYIRLAFSTLSKKGKESSQPPCLKPPLKAKQKTKSKSQHVYMYIATLIEIEQRHNNLFLRASAKPAFNIPAKRRAYLRKEKRPKTSAS